MVFDSGGPSIRFKAFGEALKHWRKKQGWTLEEAADKLGSEATLLSRLERGIPGRYKPPEIIPTALNWAEKLGLDAQPEDHAHFLELALQGRHGADVLQDIEHDSDLHDLWWWFSRRWAPPVEKGLADRLMGSCSVHECVGRVAELALKEGSGDLGFREPGDRAWDIWRVEATEPKEDSTTAKERRRKRRSK